MGSDPPPLPKIGHLYTDDVLLRLTKVLFHDLCPLRSGIESKCLLACFIALPTFSYHLELPGILSWSASRTQHPKRPFLSLAE